jgi:hypothetical protein
MGEGRPQIARFPPVLLCCRVALFSVRASFAPLNYLGRAEIGSGSIAPVLSPHLASVFPSTLTCLPCRLSFDSAST